MTILPSQTKKISKEVDVNDADQFSDVIDLATQMTALCKEPLGNYERGAVALAHCQVDHDNPKRFFATADGRVFINPTSTQKIPARKIKPNNAYNGFIYNLSSIT